MSKNETKAKNLPVAKIRVSGITVSIWENKGDKATTYSASFDRRYRDADNNWHSSASYNADDLLALAKAADLAHTKILEFQEAAQ